MTREEITNNVGYAQEKANLEYIRQRQEYGVNDPYMITEIDEAFDAGYDKGYQYAKTYPNWISVEDDLPKEKQKVLAYFSPNEECEHEYACMALYNYGFHHWEDAEDPGIILEGVTHWMPIVPPRKEE